MINRLWTGAFGLPGRGGARGTAVGRVPRAERLWLLRPNMSGVSRGLPDRGAASAAPGGNQISSLICPQNTTRRPVNLHQSWNFL